jgi:anti-anti-sigma factor
MPQPLGPDPELDDVQDRVGLTCPTGALAIVELVGEHDLGHYKPLNDALHLAAARRRHVLVDLSRCAFIDSTVVTLLLAARDEVTSDHGLFALVIPAGEGSMARVAEVMGLVEMFTIYSNRRDAAAGTAHVTRLRDLGAGLGASKGFVAECSCGWHADLRTGVLGMRAARTDAMEHADAQFARARSGPSGR